MQAAGRASGLPSVESAVGDGRNAGRQARALSTAALLYACFAFAVAIVLLEQAKQSLRFVAEDQ